MSGKVNGLPIRVEPTGRAEVTEPVEKWPEVDGVDLQEPVDLSLDVFDGVKVARTKISGILVPVVLLGGDKAMLIQPYVEPNKDSSCRGSSFTGPSFSKNGAAKPRDVSFYPNAWAARKSADVKAEVEAGL